MQRRGVVFGKLRLVIVARRLLRSRVVRTLLFVAIPFAIARLPGCASTPASTQPTSFTDQQNAAMNDPFNYKPTFNGNNDTGSFDSNGMKKDMNDVLNP